MHWDFEAILVTVTLVGSIIWALDSLYLRKKRGAAPEPWWVEYSRAFAPVLLIVVILRSFIVEPFRIPSGSMMPTLLTGDFILVNKFTYGIRLPVFHTKLIPISEPERGDVVVFRYPEDPTVDFIKRVVGLPGDEIGYSRKTLFINGKAQTLTSNGIYTGTGSSAEMNGVAWVKEDLSGLEHDILIAPVPYDFGPGCSFLANGPVKVPEGHYLVLGDNRDASKDSRCWGLVPEENLVGRAFMVWMHWDIAHSWSSFQWSRAGNSI